MIKFNFCISNPFKQIDFTNIKWWAGKTFIPNKAWEIQFMRWNTIATVKIEIMPFTSFHQRVIDVELGLFSYHVIFMIYDTRHLDQRI